MPAVRIRGHVSGRAAADALALVTDYERWPDASEAVEAVRVVRDGDGRLVSYWDVTFRRGLMQWSERDEIDLDRLVATFELIEGDPEVFAGRWTAEPTGDGCVVTMDSTFDLGMPSLGHILDPIAIEAIEDAVDSVLRALFGDDVRVEFGLDGERSAESAA